MLGALIKSLFGPARIVEIEGPDAPGEAGSALPSLIREIQVLGPDQIRPESREDYLDAVLLREGLEAYEVQLEGVFGKPAKPFDEKGKFVGDLDEMVDSIGGIDKDQCLYLRRFEDGKVLYAALWPWEDPENVTLKLGMFDQSLPAIGD